MMVETRKYTTNNKQMKLNKTFKVCLAFLLSILSTSIMAEENVHRLYMNNVTVTKGSATSELSIYLENTTTICSFDCRLYLPEGVDVFYGENEDEEEEYFINKGLRCKNAHTVSKKKQADGSFIILLSSTTNATLKENDKSQSVVNIVLDMTNAKVGTSEIVLKNITMNHYEAGLTVPYSQEEARCALTVEPAGIHITEEDKTLTITSENGTVLSATDYSSIAEGNTSNAIDLSNAVLANDITVDLLKTADARLYYLSAGTTLTGKNIVAGDVCPELEIIDGKSFSVPRSFTATTATYERSMTNTWGTIMLPYEVKSDETVEYYIPTGVANNVLVLEKQETLPANTPALVAKMSGDKIQSNAANVTVSAEAGSSVHGTVTMYGSYENNKKVTDADAYYIKNNAFVRCNGYFFIDAFRSYFTVSGGASAKTIGIPGFEATAIETLLNDDKSDAVNYYDESGRQMKGLKSGMNIMRLSNGQVIKVKR